MSLTMEDIEKDGFLKPFTQENFDVGNHVTSLLSKTSSSLTQLSGSIASIDQQIHGIVTTHHGDLLAQTSNVELMETVVQNCNKKATMCLRSVEDVKSKLNALHVDISQQVDYLENLYKANQAVRRIRTVMDIDQKAGKEKNTADVASCVTQIEYLCLQSPKLDFLKPYHDKALSLRHNIEKQTENMLNQGLLANNTGQVIGALQIFVNLDVLEEKVVKILHDIERFVERDVRTALEVKLQAPSSKGGGPGRAVLPSTSKAVGQTWTNLEGLVLKIVFNTGKVKLLWKAVLAGKDTCSGLPFLDFLQNGESNWIKFWNNFMDILIRNFSSLKLEFIKAAFENDFPRLLEIFCNLGAKIEEGAPTNLSVQTGLRGVLSNYEKAYLSKSLARLFDAVNQNFASVPTSNNIDAIVRVIQNELNIKDTILKKLVSRNVNKTINLVCVKAEQLFINDGNSTQVIGPPTESQSTNAQLLNSLDYFKTQFPESGESITVLSQNCMNPLVAAVTDAVDAIILTMHNENFQRSRTVEYSLYIGELQNFITRVSKDYLSVIKSTELIQKCGTAIASRTIDLFTRHVCLLSSLNLESTRSQILIDLNQMEIVLTPVCPVLSDLGRPYKLLKGFKTLLSLSMEEIATSNLVGSVVPYSLTIHMLFRFSQAEMKMPHTNNGWSTTRYSKWLDEHPSETERLTLLKATLESYVHSVKFKGGKEFIAVYPQMTSLLQKGMLGLG